MCEENCGVTGIIMGNVCAILCFEQYCSYLVPKTVPFKPEHLTTEFVNSVLRERNVISEEQCVTSVKTELFGVGDGFFSQMHRLHLTYSPSGAGPKTIVAKLSPSHPKTRIAGSLLSLFRYEFEFYHEDVANSIGLRVPKCYYSGFGGYGRVCLLLEDFAPATPPDQIKGLSKSQITETISQISKLHAKYRGRVAESPELRWVLKQDDDFYFKVAMGEITKKRKHFEKYMKLVLRLKTEQYVHLMSVVNWLYSNSDTYLRLLMSSFRRANKNMFPSTLVHGDLRGENLLFKQKHINEFMMYDFQCIKEMNGMIDISYHIASSMNISDRRKHERDLLVGYYNKMRELGASDLTWEEVLLMYQLNHVWIVMVTTFSISSNAKVDDAQPPRDVPSDKSSSMGLQYILRSNAVIKDWNVLKALERWSKKLHDDNTIDRFTRKEQLEILPESFCDLLKVDDNSTSKVVVEKEQDDSGEYVGVRSSSSSQCTIS